jgi:hypothetical protein
MYLILAEICLTIGAPNWVVTICWMGFADAIARAICKGILKAFENYKKTEGAKIDAEIEKVLEKL